MVVLAPLSSLTLPTGRAMPLVRGEGRPGGVAPGGVLGCAVAERPTAEGLACPHNHASSVLGAGSRGILRRQKCRLPNYGRVPYSEQDARSSCVADRGRAWVGYVVDVLPEVALSVFG